MPHDPKKPLLRLNNPEATDRRRSGGGGGRARQFDPEVQARAYGPVFRQLRSVLDRTDASMQLRADPNSLAPERLLVLEVTGSVQNFANAVARIAGLEFSGEETLEADEDASPEFYLLVPQLGALREIVSLWENWQLTGTVPRNYTPWRDLFLQLRDIRPWGPADRVSQSNREYFRNRADGAASTSLVRIEIELVFRANTAASETAESEVVRRVVEMGGNIVHRSLRREFAYHALLVDVTADQVLRIAELDPTSLAGADPVAFIVPQSVGTPVNADDRVSSDVVRPTPPNPDPIAAIFDAVPVQAHALLADQLAIDDPENLESQAVGPRIHGTAMASLVLHGDLNDPPSPINRRVYFRPVMYAPALGDEIFDENKLVVDTVVEAVMRMRANGGTQVILVNLSLGDRTRPFSGKISTWGRALDFLAFTYGILFLVSAGNTSDSIPPGAFATGAAFMAATPFDRAKAVFQGLDALKADRRILAPSDSVNAITIGGWHRDSSQEVFPSQSLFPPYDGQDMPNLYSRLGPGVRRATKPEVLLAGGRQRLRLSPIEPPPKLDLHPHPTRYWGLKVAAPPENGAAGLHFTIGTSAATALATHSAHRIFDALEEAYPQLIAPMPLVERAALLKALLVHAASWRGSEAFIRSIIDPTLSLHHEHWRREVSRHLGYGFVDPEDAIACAADRATMWATGTLLQEGSLTFDIPIPAALAANANEREVKATLAWFTPIRPGHLAYRAVKLRITSLQTDALEVAGVKTTTGQPSNSQSESGTAVHRRWRGALIGSAASIPLQIQREKDQGVPIDEPIPFGLAVTVEMPGAVEVYDQVRTSIQVQPRALVGT